jgi:hypothetical protein
VELSSDSFEAPIKPAVSDARFSHNQFRDHPRELVFLHLSFPLPIIEHIWLDGTNCFGDVQTRGHLLFRALREWMVSECAETMYVVYHLLTSTPALSCDEKLSEEMESTNAQELTKLDERLAEAEKTEGEGEISDALKAKANYLTRIQISFTFLKSGERYRKNQ